MTTKERGFIGRSNIELFGRIFVVLFLSFQVLFGQKPDSLGKDSLRVPLRYSALSYLARWDSISADTLFDRTVITHAELLKYYHEDLADILERYAGIYAQDLGSFGRPISVTLDANAQLRILLDGIPMNSSDVSWTSLNMISLDNIERIEIFRGVIPYINIVTRRVRNEPVTTFKYRSISAVFRDVGIYFGRPIGQRWRLYAGGASRGTPVEQFINRVESGALLNSNRSRYSATQYFGGLDYLVTDLWMMKFYYQSNADRYDFYGRNISSSGVDFTSPGGLRHENRDMYRTSINYLKDETAFEWVGEKSNTQHRSQKFLRSPVPKEYSASRYSSDGFFSKQISNHNLRLHLRIEADRVDSLLLPDRSFQKAQLDISDQFRIHEVMFQPKIDYAYHSIYHSAGSFSLDAQRAFTNILVLAGLGYQEEFPSFIEELQNTVQTFPYIFTNGPSQSYSFPRDSVSTLPTSKNIILNGGAKMAVNQILNSFEVRGFYRHYTGGNYLSQVHRDSIENRSLKGAEVYGMEITASRKWGWTDWSFRQVLTKGDDAARMGIPYYRAYLTGYGEGFFFEKNLKLAGDLTGTYYSRHSGWSYKDAPTVYYATPNYRKGGFLFFTRISAYIGDIQIYYEAENIFRSHFERLDGYPVTPQQYRFGFVWHLFN